MGLRRDADGRLGALAGSGAGPPLGRRRAALTLSVAPFGGSPAERLGALIAESERDGLTFVRRLADEWISGANRFDRPGETLLVAESAGRVVGVCGLNVDPYAARPGIGRVRHLYVLIADRQHGTGARLVGAIMESARGHFATLRLRTNNPAAARLYERLGFARADGVADCTHVLELGRR